MKHGIVGNGKDEACVALISSPSVPDTVLIFEPSRLNLSQSFSIIVTLQPLKKILYIINIRI